MTSIYLLISDPIHARRLQNTLAAEPGIEVAGWVNTLAAARHQLAGRRPTMLIADLTLADGHASELIEDFGRTNAYGRPQTVVLVPALDDAALIGAMQAGADGYVLDTAMPRDIVQTVRLVLAGASPMDRSVALRVKAHFDDRVWDHTDYVGEAQSPLHLTDEERLLLERTAEGYDLATLAKGHRTTVAMVGQKLRTIYRKMQLDLRAAGLSLELA